MDGLTNLVLSERHECVHLRLHAAHPLRPPHEPELEDVVVAAALDHLVARVVGDVVVLVALEQVVGRHLVAADQEALQRKIIMPSGQTSSSTCHKTALTFSLTCSVEHWRSVPISLWGFHVSESALKWDVITTHARGIMGFITHLSIPLNLVDLNFLLIMRPPPQAAFKVREDISIRTVQMAPRSSSTG